MNSDAILREIAGNQDIDPSLKSHMLKTLLNLRADISDSDINTRLLKKLVVNYADAEKKLYELNQLKNKFLGIAAHDLRNPLTSIRGFSELLLAGELGDIAGDQKEFIAMIHTLSQTMLELVNDLLDVSVIESGRLSLKKKIESIADLVTTHIRIAAMIAEAKGMSITASIADIPSFAFDGVRVGQVIDNLISNAVKFSPYNSTIEIRAFQDNGKAVISVADQGPGISFQDRERLFGEFARLSAQPTGEEKSTGLGLAICKKIIQAHGGAIWVENRDKAGSEFFFTLPMKRSL